VRPGVGRHAARFGAAALLAAVSATGCDLPPPAYGASYTGTGRLSASGLQAKRPPSPSYARALSPALGDTCRVEGWAAGIAFDPIVGSACTLAFAKGPETFRVTDVVTRSGQAGRWVDTSYLEVQIGGDDVVSQRHVFYAFSGRARAADGLEAQLCATSGPAVAPPNI